MLAGCLGVGYYMWFVYNSLVSKQDEPVTEKQSEDVEAQEEEEEHEEGSVRKGIGYLCLGKNIRFLFVLITFQVDS